MVYNFRCHTDWKDWEYYKQFYGNKFEKLEKHRPSRIKNKMIKEETKPLNSAITTQEIESVV